MSQGFKLTCQLNLVTIQSIMDQLSQKHCQACAGEGTALDQSTVDTLMAQLSPGWHLDSEHRTITKEFHFKGFYKTMAFVNAVAWIANEEQHHPDLAVSYNRCIVHYTTHAISDLSENDFICAAKIDNLLT